MARLHWTRYLYIFPLLLVLLALWSGTVNSKSFTRRHQCQCEDDSNPTSETCHCLSGYGGQVCIHSNNTGCECCLSMFVPMCDRLRGCINAGEWDFHDNDLE